MIIPHDELHPDTLQALVEEFVTRDGTDYGEQEATLSQKVSAVKQRLTVGDAVILFSESTGQCNIVPRNILS